MRVRASCVIGVGLTLVVASGAVVTAQTSQETLLARAAQYSERFQAGFLIVIGEEHYRQRLSGSRYVAGRERSTRAEMLFMWLPEERRWMTVRQVQEVDGRAVTGETLSQLLTDRERLARLRAESARYNLGRLLYRDFNSPTLVVELLHPAMQPRFRFTEKGRERINGIETRRVQFKEVSRPTIIQQLGADLFSEGTVWLRDTDGAVVRSDLRVAIPLRYTHASMTVDFTRDDRLDVWVPSRMKESYQALDLNGTLAERVDTEATYRNFRRFETSGRVVP